MKDLLKLLAIILFTQSSMAFNKCECDTKQIMITHPEGSMKSIFINKNTPWEELKRKMKDAYDDYEQYANACNGRSLIWDRNDEGYAQEIMNHILTAQFITLTVRQMGGNDVISKMLQIIKNDKLEEIFCNNDECSICGDKENSVSNFSCGCHYCKECFNNFFNIFSCEGKKNCSIHKKHDLINEVVGAVIDLCDDEIKNCFIRLVGCLDLIKHMDYKFCKCEVMHNNTTGYARQFCETCKEYVCFFCNESWNEEKVNKVGYCGPHCYYYVLLSFNLVTWEQGNSDIPSTRFCPNCGIHGGVDDKCKFHTCKCGYTFCFFCLKKEEECKKEYKKTCYEKCIEPIMQDLSTVFLKNKL